MRTGVVVALVIALYSTANAEPFLSPGVSVAFGSRGWSFGVEVSAGFFSDVPIVPGVVGGFEISPFAKAGQPWGRLYGEIELVSLVGVAGGPNLLFGDSSEVSWQVTTFVVVPTEIDDDSGSPRTCVTPVIVPYYRFTHSSETSGFHDAGVFGKLVMSPVRWSC